MDEHDKDTLAASLTKHLNENGVPGRLVWVKPKKEKPSLSAAQWTAANKMKVMWNTFKHVAMPRALGVHGQRAITAAARWNERPDEEFWKATIQRLAQSQFCCGKNDRSWTASFDWFIRPGTTDMIHEGKYDDGKLSGLISHATQPKPAGPLYNED